MLSRNVRTDARPLHSRRALAAILAALALSLSVTPAAAGELENIDARGHVYPGLDAVALRPLGLVATALGGALFVVSVPVVAITRPQDIMRPFDSLVMQPIQYTWLDPIGDHSATGL